MSGNDDSLRHLHKQRQRTYTIYEYNGVYDPILPVAFLSESESTLQALSATLSRTSEIDAEVGVVQLYSAKNCLALV